MLYESKMMYEEVMGFRLYQYAVVIWKLQDNGFLKFGVFENALTCTICMIDIIYFIPSHYMLHVYELVKKIVGTSHIPK